MGQVFRVNNKSHLQNLGRIWPLLRIDLQGLRQIVPEDGREHFWVGNRRRTVGRNEVQCLQRILIEVWRFALDHFYVRNESDDLKLDRGYPPIAIIPRLQISTFGPYSFRVTTSGAIQYGVPTMVVRFALPSEIWAQKPKSAEDSRLSILFAQDEL